MNEYYNLIWDENQVKQFFNRIPTIDKDEAHMVSLFARSKYLQEGDNLKLNVKDSCIDRRFIKRKQSEQDYLNMVRRYSVPKGSYTDKNGTELPDHVLALYGSVNPRSGRKGTKELYVELMDALLSGQDWKWAELDHLGRSKLQKYASRKMYCCIDIDQKDEAYLDGINEFFTKDVLSSVDRFTIETRGGWHVLASIKEMGKLKKTWKPALDVHLHQKNMAHIVEVKTDTLSPIPGTIQGGFKVRFIDE